MVRTLPACDIRGSTCTLASVHTTVADPHFTAKNMRKAVLRSALCWGDTSTWYDYATRVLTISDGASMLCFPEIVGCNPSTMPWVFRNHAAIFHQPLKQIHNKCKNVDAIPRVIAVGKSSWRFACDVIDQESQRPLASTRGTFVLVDGSLTYSTPIPSNVADALRGRIADESDANQSPALASLDAKVSQRPAFLASEQCHEQANPVVVRATDADALGHVNNAKWALLIAEALHYGASEGRKLSIQPKGWCSQPCAISIDFLGQAKPGDLLSCRLVSDGTGGTHFGFHVADKAITHATILQRSEEV